MSFVPLTRNAALPSIAVTEEEVVPFLKWAGGKRWLVSNYAQSFPTSFTRYFEPFLGSAAVFFHLQPAQPILSDSNPELINAYLIIKEEWERLEAALERHQAKHCESHYYAVRAAIPKNLIDRAARFLYLNRTCWNGLYRENKIGQFNVPIGTKDAVVLDEDDFASVSKRLQEAELVCCDFEETVNRAGSGDLLFVDPPYTVRHNVNGFIKYNQKIFSWDDQIRLRDAVVRARDRGALVMMTNANHQSVKELYRDFSTKIVSRRSTISGKASTRGSAEELLITAL